MSDSKAGQSDKQQWPTPSEKKTADAGKPGADENAAGFLKSPEDEDADPVGDGSEE